MRFPIFQKEKELALRKTNLNDVFRAFGCFCIIWYHSGYYWELSQTDRIDVDNFKLVFISWAMPFFYTSSFYYAAKYGYKKVQIVHFSAKIVRMSSLLLFVVVVYQTIQITKILLYEGATGILITTQNKDSIFDWISFLWTQFSTGGGTPAYFIFEIILIYPIGYGIGFISRHYLYCGYLAILCFSALGILQRSIFENISYKTSFYLSLAIALLIYTQQDKKFRSIFHLIIIMIVSALILNKTEIVIWPVLVIAIFFALNKTNKFMIYLSEFGQKYSLFVFSFHVLALEFTGVLAAIVVNQNNLLKSSILIFIIINFISNYLLQY